MDVILADAALVIKAGNVNLRDLAATLILLQLNAVAGVGGTFDSKKNLMSIGSTRSFCH